MKPLKMTLVMILFTSLFFGACENNTIVEPPIEGEEEESAFDMLWATRMNAETEIVNLNNSKQYEEWLLYSGDLDEPPTIMAFNKDTGEKDWEYIHEGIVNDEIDVSTVFDNIYVGMCNSGIVGINLNTQTSMWEIDFKSLNITRGVKFDLYDGFLYFRSVWSVNTPVENTRLYKLNPHTGEINVTYQTSKGLISPPVFNQKESDICVIINGYPFENELPQESVQNLIKVDLESGKELWRTQVTSQFASNVGLPSVIYDNRIVITGGHNSIFGYDVYTGELLWEYEDPNSLGFAQWADTNHLIHEDRLYVNENAEEVTCLNPETGALIWNNPMGGANCTDNMIYYEKEDLLVFTSWGYGSVMVLDALSGKTVHRERKFDNSQYNNDVVYDEGRDMFFTTSFKHAIGFKVKRPE